MRFPDDQWMLTPAGLRAWALLHLLVWSLVPWLCNTCLPLDSVEAVMWGSEWQWGYDKHPPLSAWAAQLFARALGDVGIYFLSQLCVVAAAWGVYRLARLLQLTVQQSVLAALLIEAIYFYQYSSVEFNVNILQLPFWAWAWYFGHDGLVNHRWRSWLGLGLCVGLGALTKYIAVFLLIPLFAAWWQSGLLWTALRSKGLWVAGVISLLIFSPHLQWMAEHDWMTITYGLRRSGNESVLWWQHLWHPVQFLVSQLAILLPLVWISCMYRKNIGNSHVPAGAMGLAFAAYLFLLLLSLATGMKPVTMWAAPMPLAIGIWLVPRYQMQLSPQKALRTLYATAALALVAYIIVYGLGPRIRDKPHRVNYPARELAAEVEKRWHQNVSQPLNYVIADEFLGGIVNHYGTDHASVMIRANLQRSAYLTEEEVRQKGAVVLWLKSRDVSKQDIASLDKTFPDLKNRFPTMQEQPDMLLSWPRRTDGKSGCYGLAIIPPQKNQ